MTASGFVLDVLRSMAPIGVTLAVVSLVYGWVMRRLLPLDEVPEEVAPTSEATKVHLVDQGSEVVGYQPELRPLTTAEAIELFDRQYGAK